MHSNQHAPLDGYVCLAGCHTHLIVSSHRACVWHYRPFLRAIRPGTLPRTNATSAAAAAAAWWWLAPRVAQLEQLQPRVGPRCLATAAAACNSAAGVDVEIVGAQQRVCIPFIHHTDGSCEYSFSALHVVLAAAHNIALLMHSYC